MNENVLPPREVTLRFLASLSDNNHYGNIHGGAVMKWIDEAGYICAAGWSSRACVTVFVSSMRFYKPIEAGSLVEVQAKLIYTGKTSMHIAVEVEAGDPRSHQKQKTTHCIIVFVALDEDCKPVAVPKWQPQSEEDRALERHALRLMELNRVVETEMKTFLKE